LGGLWKNEDWGCWHLVVVQVGRKKRDQESLDKKIRGKTCSTERVVTGEKGRKKKTTRVVKDSKRK